MISDAEVLSQLIGVAYDAALDPLLWPRVLEQTCAFVGTCAAMIFAQDAALKSGNRYYSWGDDPTYTRLYFEKYIKMSPFIVAQHLFQIGEVKTIHDLVPHDELLETQFHREWMKPQGYLDNIFSNIDKSVTSYAAFAVVRHERQGFAGEEARQRMALIVPHVRRAILISKLIDLHKAERAVFTEALDGIAAGVFLVRSNGQIVFANAAAQVMLGEQRIVRGSQGLLSAVDPQANRALQDVFGASRHGDVAVGTKGISVPLSTSSEQHWIAHVLPLTRRQADISRTATAAVFVRKAALDTPAPMEVIAKVYKLTPGELRVLIAVLEVGGVAAIADALGISEATVRTHLHHVFEKTGTSGQVDLVKLVAAHASPFGN